MSTRVLFSISIVLILGFCSFPPSQPELAAAQFPGGGDLDARLPQPLGSPTSTVFRTPPGRGEIFDREALGQTRSFCVDSSHMGESEVTQLKDFLAKESQPKKLLSKLPWKLIDDCTKADAVARIYFAPVDLRVDIRDEESGRKKSWNPGQSAQPVLLIYDKASIRLFYRAEGEVLRGKAVDALGSPFSTLLKDLKQIDR
ncbi:MAG TPA: hypothetical protein VI455_09300 [Terriglobia bacterium]